MFQMRVLEPSGPREKDRETRTFAEESRMKLSRRKDNDADSFLAVSGAAGKEAFLTYLDLLNDNGTNWLVLEVRLLISFVAIKSQWYVLTIQANHNRLRSSRNGPRKRTQMVLYAVIRGSSQLSLW